MILLEAVIAEGHIVESCLVIWVLGGGVFAIERDGLMVVLLLESLIALLFFTHDCPPNYDKV